MSPKNIRPPGPRSGERVRERWEEDISKKLDNSSFSLDDVARALLLTNSTTQGQENDNSVRYLTKLLADNASLRGKITELERRLNDLEKIAWL